MFTGISIHETKPYVSKYDPDKNNPTTFQIGSLDPFLRSFIDDQATSFKVSSKNPDAPADATIAGNKRNILVVKFGLKGLENFIDPQTKKPVPFDTVSIPVNGKNYLGVNDEIIKMFPQELIIELAEAILSANKLSEEERKN